MIEPRNGFFFDLEATWILAEDFIKNVSLIHFDTLVKEDLEFLEKRLLERGKKQTTSTAQWICL